MLRDRQRLLQARCAQLALRSEVLRTRLSLEAQALERPLALADRARSGIEWLRARPPLALGLAALPLLLRPRRALRWGLRLWGAWGLWRRAKAALR